MSTETTVKAPAPPKKFGTFGGVFTPSTLTILGVIMFLRFGQVVGESGIYHAVLIILCAKLITTLTAFSISAVATNTRVEGGGAYFLISRSLGVEFGGAIGIVFFLAQAISVAMYVIGFTEALVNLFPDSGYSALEIGSVVNFFVFVCVFIGAGWTIKMQYGILAILLLSLISFFAGALPEATAARAAENMGPGYTGGQSVFTMFALFVPAVTGIMAGVNMSGDLKNPGRSIPGGTIAAIAFTALVYLGMAWTLAAAVPRDTLQTNAFIVADIAKWPIAIHAGIFAATLSSALGSMMGAPRILQAVARDRIFKGLNRFAIGGGNSDEPRRATIVAFLIAQAALMVGDLNAIAPIITMFFMVTYGTINLACFYESVTKNPSYRPAFKLSNRFTALLGTVGCVAVMIFLEPLWAIVAIGAMAALHWWIGRKQVYARWGNVTSGVAYERARKALLRLEMEKYHSKNWRPAILALSGGAFRRNHLTEYGSWLTAGRGILSFGQIIVGEVEENLERRNSAEVKLRKFIAEEEVEGFPAVVVEDSVLMGLAHLLQCHGIGGLRSNTVMLGWSENPEHASGFFEMQRMIRRFERSIIIVQSQNEGPLRWAPPKGSIDIWWRGGKNGNLMLTLAHLLKQNSGWRGRKIRILVPIDADQDPDKAQVPLLEMIEKARVDAVPVMLPTESDNDAWKAASAEAAVVFIGYDPPREEEVATFHKEISDAIEDLQQVLLVSSSGGVSLAG
ncbi:MAG: amino acid permease [Verrucomicrobiales bacterium]|nr:amino acid permease [Verrucomicrobiales bacterium]